MVFKAVPNPSFSATLTELYPFLRVPEDRWPAVMKKFQHPVHALWPLPKVCRYLHFYQVFRAKRKQLFHHYELQNGIYHGPDVDVATLVSTTSVNNLPPVEGSETDESDSGDAEFV
jgi:hypothetical protein